MGDALHALHDLGAGALRLDANGFLGVGKSAEGGAPTWSEGHPPSEAATRSGSESPSSEPPIPSLHEQPRHGGRW
jgi:hypothetical protein